MKQLFRFWLVAALLLVAGCVDEYDDSALVGRVDDLEGRVQRLEQLCQQMNTNISSLQTIVTALQNNDYVTGVTPIAENGKTIGYTITFAKSQSITIYHGKDGQNGADGKDGQDGTDGKDSDYVPTIGVKQDTDGIYYWTLDGEWLLDEAGNKIKAQGIDGKDGADGKDGKDGANGTDGKDGKDGVNGADGKDGITPQLKIENGYWYISYDNGASWTQLGKATGEDGKDGTNGADGTNGVDGEDGKNGDSFFQSVDTSNDEYVIFTLADGTQIQLPTWYAFEQLRTLCNQMNTNIASLQSIVNALQNHDYITSCTPLMEDGTQIGYTITFAKSGSIVIYHGKDGQDGSDGEDGENGTDGKDGADGKDGSTPVIGVKQDYDDIYYWTLDGEWLTDELGNKIKAQGTDGKDGQGGEDGINGADGKDGITPQLKIENDYWYVSYDNGASWTQLGKATGEDGKDGINGTDGTNGVDGKSFFQDVTQDESNVYFTLADGTVITLPKALALSIEFAENDLVVMSPNIAQDIVICLCC